MGHQIAPARPKTVPVDYFSISIDTGPIPKSCKSIECHRCRQFNCRFNSGGQNRKEKCKAKIDRTTLALDGINAR